MMGLEFDSVAAYSRMPLQVIKNMSGVANTGRGSSECRRIVITGGPGAGKTTLLLALQARGHTIVGDSPRNIIQNRRKHGSSPRPDAYEFAHETLRMDIENFLHHAATPGYVFFERSVLDALCGLDRVAPLNGSELGMWLSKYQYCSKVFVLPPWKAIYVNDDERDHTFEHAESVYRIMQEWYRRLDQYQVIEVPKVSVAERCTYVLQALANSDG
jgi:predicted ATPase